MTKSPKPPSQKPTPAPPNVMLPPIDATPEEVAHALFQRPPLKKPKGDDADAF